MSGPKILVVEDNPLTRKMLRVALESEGYSVIEAADGRAALRAVEHDMPALILQDLILPDMNGVVLAGQLRARPGGAEVPIIALSGFSGSIEDARRIEAGFTALFVKPIEPSRLIAEISKYLPSAAERRSAAPLPAENGVPAASDLVRRCTLQAAQIALLGGIAEALSREKDTDSAVRDVLAATLDAAGISKGALYLRNADRRLELRHAIGFSDEERAGLGTFFGHFALVDDAVERQMTSPIPSSVPNELARTVLDRAGASTMQIVPLLAEGRGIGAMILAANRTDVTNEDATAFARAMGNQLAQSLVLASAFARLVKSEERYRTVTESANDAISILTPEGVILEVNASLEDMLGLPRERIVGRHITEFAASGHKMANVARYEQSLNSGTSTGGTVALRRAGGGVVHAEFSTKRVELGGESVVVSIGRDVSERVKTQAQLMVSDRMASVGMLAAGVAHEINNPLAATTANLALMTEEVAALEERVGAAADFSELRQMLRDAREAADRVRTIVRDLKIFSRAEEEKRGPVDVERVLDSSLRMAHNEIRHRAELVREYTAVPVVEANESRLGQVFLNLIVNAAQALPDGFATLHKIRVRIRMADPETVVVDIEDTGPGMSEDVLKRLFTPFFTTKPKGVGTGLGLSICQRIVTDLGGHITVDSRVGRGSTFSVALPVAPASAASTSDVPAARPSAPPRRARVLVVDDESMILAAVRRILAAHHDVTTTESATDALGRILGGESFDVIICDLMMPVMTGVELHAELSARSPEHAERVIFLTGGAFTVKAREFLDQVPNPRLEKPFEGQTLRALVNERLR